VTQNIRINLLKGGVVVGTIANSIPANNSPFLWTAGKLADGTMVQPGADYRVRIRAIESSEVDESDGMFAIVAPAPPPPPPPPPPVLLKLKWPNGGENLVLHRDYAISWESIAPDTVGKVQLDLMIYKKETEQWMIGVIADNLPATGSYTWKAGEYPGQTAGAGQYRIRVRSMTSNDHADSSDAPFRLRPIMKEIGKSPMMKKAVALPGIYQNHHISSYTTFPSNITYLPPEAYQGAWNQVIPGGCYAGGAHSLAQVGVYWYPYQNIMVGILMRARIHFELNPYAGQAGRLKSAKLKMKRLHSVHEDANSGCGCGENLWVLKAPMTSFDFPAIGQRIGVDLGTSEFTEDVTDIVRQWLDGTVANNGLLLLGAELPCSGGRKCASCYEATLVLDIQ